METGVLGNALEGVDVDAEDNTEADEKEQFEPVDKLTGEEASSKDSEDAEKEKGGEEEEGEEEEEEEGEEEGEGEGGDGEEGAADGEKKDEEDGDDVSNLQLAWEMLDLAKVIYLKDPSKESSLKAAEAYLKLGEVSMETEAYEQATEDIKSCLKIQQEHLEHDDRAIAETHYQLGLAYQLNKQTDCAIDEFRAAVKCLENKIESLKKTVEANPPKDPSEFIAPAEKAAKEIKDIEEILPEIRNKIEDAQEEVKQLDSLKSMAKEAMGVVFAAVDSVTETGFSSKAESSPTKSTEEKKTSDISHLVRKKRKPEDEAPEGDAESKKLRKEGSTGDAEEKPTLAQNGHVEMSIEKPAETVEPMATG
nr:hypothetical protein BaRGS_008149 [Batillaria attramentaria]